MARYKGLPNVLIVMFALIALFVFVTTRTTFGRRIYAMGGNEKATKLSGHQYRAPDLSDLHHHGRAGGPWRAHLRGPPQRGNPQGRRWVSSST